MSNAVPAKIGNVNSGSTRDDALFLKVFAGEVLTSFEVQSFYLKFQYVYVAHQSTLIAFQLGLGELYCFLEILHPSLRLKN